MTGIDRVDGLDVERTAFDSTGRLTGTGQIERLPVQLVVRSVGYRGLPTEGLPFDTAEGIIPHRLGAVLSDGDQADELALLMAASIFNRLRIMPASCISRATSFLSNAATLRASKPANALRKFSRLCSTVRQLNPAWNDSSTRDSKSFASSCWGLPHSQS